MESAEIFAPWRLVASFADGSRLLFDGLTEQLAKNAMENAQREHGCISWWDRVTDLNYENGRYYKTLPLPPCVNIVDYKGYTGPLDENGLPVGLAEQIARTAAEEGYDSSDPQIIIKRNVPPDADPPADPPHEK